VDLAVDTGIREGELHFGVIRDGWIYDEAMSAGWACAEGHTVNNHLTYNQALDTWGRLCYTDASSLFGDRGSSEMAYGLYYDIIGQSGGNVEIHSGRPQWSARLGSGGTGAMVSRGNRGFLAVGSDMDPCNNTNESPYIRSYALGLAPLPAEQNSCTGNGGNEACQMNYIQTPLLPGGNTYPRFNSSLGTGDVGGLLFTNIAHIGPSGEEGRRYLVGFGTDCGTSCPTYNLMETDEDGHIYGRILQLEGVIGWGELEPWTAMEDLGCVAWPFAWNKEVGAAYGPTLDSPSFDATQLTSVLQIHVVCPQDMVSSIPTDDCARNCDPSYYPNSCKDYSCTVYCPSTHSSKTDCTPDEYSPNYGSSTNGQLPAQYAGVSTCRSIFSEDDGQFATQSWGGAFVNSSGGSGNHTGASDDEVESEDTGNNSDSDGDSDRSGSLTHGAMFRVVIAGFVVVSAFVTVFLYVYLCAQIYHINIRLRTAAEQDAAPRIDEVELG